MIIGTINGYELLIWSVLLTEILVYYTCSYIEDDYVYRYETVANNKNNLKLKRENISDIEAVINAIANQVL